MISFRASSARERESSILFNLEEAISIIIENQENKKFTKKVKPVIKKVHEPVSIVCDYKEIKTNVEIPKVNIGLKIPLKNFETLKLNREELSMYLSIILNCNFGNSSRLKEQLVSGNIITDGIIAQKYFTDDYLIINIIITFIRKWKVIPLQMNYSNISTISV